jgi:hypothetical protein
MDARHVQDHEATNDPVRASLRKQADNAVQEKLADEVPDFEPPEGRAICEGDQKQQLVSAQAPSPTGKYSHEW